MPLSIKPFGYKILVEETKLENAIALPDDTTVAGAFRHTIVALGHPKILADGTEIPIDLNIGDWVMFDTSAAIGLPPHMFDGRKLAIVQVDGVIGVYSGDVDLVPKKKLVTVFQ